MLQFAYIYIAVTCSVADWSKINLSVRTIQTVLALQTADTIHINVVSLTSVGEQNSDFVFFTSILTTS